MKQSTIQKWHDDAVADLKKFRSDEFDVHDIDQKVEISILKLRVYQHKIHDLCCMLLDGESFDEHPVSKAFNDSVDKIVVATIKERKDVDELMEML